MPGQFAEENGGSPGAIWKIDGLTGALSLFATIRTNSDSGIGDIAFDGAHRQFFASDLDSGRTYRIGVDGTAHLSSPQPTTAIRHSQGRCRLATP
jgi:hypothetical protein